MDLTLNSLISFLEHPFSQPGKPHHSIGENSVLNHRSEPKNLDTSVYPVENVNPIKHRAEPAPPSAVIGPKIRFKGELVGEEDLLVQGKVEGTIDLKGNHLTVGGQGVLQANVSAKTITVEGKVEGDLHGQECVSIRASSHVQGNIKAQRVVLEDGAKFKGSIDMDMDEASDIKSMANKLKKPSLPAENNASSPEDDA